MKELKITDLNQDVLTMIARSDLGSRNVVSLSVTCKKIHNALKPVVDEKFYSEVEALMAREYI